MSAWSWQPYGLRIPWYRAASLNGVITEAVTLCTHKYVVWLEVDSFYRYVNCIWSSLFVLLATWNKSIEVSELLEAFCCVWGSHTLLVKYPLSFGMNCLLYLTLILLMWRIWWAPNNASKWQMGFNLAFKGLMYWNKKFPPPQSYLICMGFWYRAALLFLNDWGWLSWMCYYFFTQVTVSIQSGCPL